MGEGLGRPILRHSGARGTPALRRAGHSGTPARGVVVIWV
jgi:hypothetical protein